LRPEKPFSQNFIILGWTNFGVSCKLAIIALELSNMRRVLLESDIKSLKSIRKIKES